MPAFFNTPLTIGSLQLPNRLIQGPLAGFSCAPFRRLFSRFTPPAYCVSEMLSAHDVLYKHKLDGRYLHRDTREKLLCYQISGTDPGIMAAAAEKLASSGADLIDINCGCPKAKIRKKGAGSALLEQPERLIEIIKNVRLAISCPLTVKIRLSANSIALVKAIADAGADAVIIHGRYWTQDYDSPCDLQQIADIKRAVTLPIVMNGDISSFESLKNAFVRTGCDAFMIARAATGKPWFYQTLLNNQPVIIDIKQRNVLFMQHLQGLADLENEHQAVLQSKSLIRYYFRNELDVALLKNFYRLTNLASIKDFLDDILSRKVGKGAEADVPTTVQPTMENFK